MTGSNYINEPWELQFNAVSGSNGQADRERDRQLIQWPLCERASAS